MFNTPTITTITSYWISIWMGKGAINTNNNNNTIRTMIMISISMKNRNRTIRWESILWNHGSWHRVISMRRVKIMDISTKIKLSIIILRQTIRLIYRKVGRLVDNSTWQNSPKNMLIQNKTDRQITNLIFKIYLNSQQTNSIKPTIIISTISLPIIIINSSNIPSNLHYKIHNNFSMIPKNTGQRVLQLIRTTNP